MTPRNPTQNLLQILSQDGMITDMVALVRKPVPLSPVEVEMLALLRTSGTWQYDTLRRVAGDGAVGSEAAALHALVDLGFQRLGDLALELGYETLAAERDDEDHAYEAAVRSRRGAADRV